MGRIVAIDYGNKRAGLAVTDPGQMIATALATIHPKDLVTYLKKYQEREGIESFVVGMPTQLNNQPSESSKYVKGFITILGKHFPEVPVFTVDERFTSKIATHSLLLSGLKKKARQNKELIDQASAVIILQSFLEQRENGAFQ